MSRTWALLAMFVVLAVAACGPAGSSESVDGGIGGVAVAGPTCPVERPGDPACAGRPVAGAAIVITDDAGAQVATVTTDELGKYFVALPAGRYVVTAQPVAGLMGIPGPVDAEVTAGLTTVDLMYDTGIR